MFTHWTYINQEEINEDYSVRSISNNLHKIKSQVNERTQCKCPLPALNLCRWTKQNKSCAITVLQSSCKISIFVFFVYGFSKNHSHRLIISAKFKFHKICSKLMENGPPNRSMYGVGLKDCPYAIHFHAVIYLVRGPSSVLVYNKSRWTFTVFLNLTQSGVFS